MKPLTSTVGQPAAQASQARPAGQPHEHGRVAQQPRPLDERPVAGQVLGAVRDVRPDQAGAVHRLLVDAQHPLAARLERRDHLAPAVRVVPVLGLAAALHGDAGVGLRDGAALVGQGEAGRRLRRVDAQDVGGGAVQPDVAEVGGLPVAGGVVEEQAERVGGVEPVGSPAPPPASWVTKRMAG